MADSAPAPVTGAAPRVSVVIPSRNEARHIGNCLAAVRTALAQAGGGEMLVVDGRSTDGTREQVAASQGDGEEVRLIDNPSRTTSAAFNLGIRAARSRRIAIVSAHCHVNAEFFAVAHCRLDAGEADIVGGTIRAEPGTDGTLGWLLAQVVSHTFGVGNSRFRVSRTAGYVDAVPFAVFNAEVFERIGMFNERLVRNQDTEFFGRAAQAGVRVLLDPAMETVYYARDTLPGLLSQGFRNAYWNVLVWRGRPAAFQWRHLVPGLFTAGILVGGLLGVVFPPIHLLLLAALAVYAVLALAASVHIARRSRRWIALCLPPIFFVYHFCYGTGSIAGLRHLLRREPEPPVEVQRRDPTKGGVGA